MEAEREREMLSAHAMDDCLISIRSCLDSLSYRVSQVCGPMKWVYFKVPEQYNFARKSTVDSAYNIHG